jgi:4'-phosphopantetheinyl transferase
MEVRADMRADGPHGPDALDKTAHLFLCQPQSINDPDLLARYLGLLDPAERERQARFRNPRDAHTFLVSHALVRTALSQFADVHPADWRFRTNEFGRPEIDGPAGTALRFNLSHCRNLVVCLVAAGAEPGVDVEEVHQADDLLDLANRYFSPDEVGALRSCRSEDVAERFFALWTLKESYIKARGMGLALPLDAFTFSFSVSDDRIAIRFDARIADQPDHWTFTLMRPTPVHCLATALRHERVGERKLILRNVVPLVELETACQVASAAQPRRE